MNTDTKISVVIPVLNEAGSIANVLRDIPDYVDEIIVADNGSTDDTVAIAEQCGANVVHEPRRGYGAACLRGIAALDEPDIVVFLDGDYSDHPDQMDALIQPILDDEVDMVIGSRKLGNAAKGALTPQARFGNQLACFLMRIFWGVRYTDLGPFRAIRYSSLQQLNMADTNYGWTVEMQIKAALHKLRTCEAHVDYRKRIGRSKVSGTLRGVIGAGTKILSTIFISAARYHLYEKRRAVAGRRLIVFTRYPEPGKTKTRLIPELGPEGAADLQRRMTERTLRTAEFLPNIEIEVHYTGADKETMIEWLGGNHEYVLQHPGNLGDRMFEAIRSAFVSDINYAVVIGTDCPAITPTVLETAFTSLHKKDITIGPATDGGYYLIGARASLPAVALGHLFTDIEWGTETVYSETQKRLNEEKIPWHRLAYLNDIDLPQDVPEWDRLQPEFDRPDLTIVIPTLNEAEYIEETLGSTRTDAKVEIIIADGGSADNTLERAAAFNPTIITAPRGRASQMNHGAARASADVVLFLHADTELPPTYFQDIESTLDRLGIVCGAFQFKTDDASLSMNVISRGTNLRSRCLQMPYGDQGLFMKKETFLRACGYPDIPIMEDYVLVKKIKKSGRIRICDTPITTCARRWHDKGLWRTTLANQLTILMYRLGRGPDKISKRYRIERK
ncbi:MAG: TIGR04283 family arsenosugar biosynthesis glycosyltransferase [Candidatus Hydrogenedentota bacterium]